MLFNSFEFLIFFPVVVGVYFIIPRRVRYVWLLVASYYFYMSWNAKYAILLAFSTIVTWLSGYSLGCINKSGQFFRRKSDISHVAQSQFTRKRKRVFVVAASLIVNLGILAFFKYFDFVLNNINVTLAIFSIEPFEKPFDLLLPVGISFYTFQALSYTVDVYRGQVEPEKNLFKYALFVSFFPQLVAGPIERSKNLLVQVEDVASFNLWNLDRVTRGMILMVWGYFLKMVIADRAAIFVNAVYNDFTLYGQVELIAATLLFGIQIMCDFAGYSIIAIGAAKVMGFELMENFNTPYFASSIQDFWRRWHISLSTWFRDYLYFPLGGSRCSKVIHCRNILIVFLVSGVWHGAAWTFVAWGFIHGVYQVVGLLTKPYKERLYSKVGVKTNASSWKLGKIVITYLLVNVAWIFFRAESITQALCILNQIVFCFNFETLFDGSLFELGLNSLEFKLLAIALLFLFLADLARYFSGKNIADYLMEQNLWFRWMVTIGLICIIFTFGVYGPEFAASDFIYFQF